MYEKHCRFYSIFKRGEIRFQVPQFYALLFPFYSSFYLFTFAFPFFFLFLVSHLSFVSWSTVLPVFVPCTALLDLVSRAYEIAIWWSCPSGVRCPSSVRRMNYFQTCCADFFQILVVRCLEPYSWAFLIFFFFFAYFFFISLT